MNAQQTLAEFLRLQGILRIIRAGDRCRRSGPLREAIELRLTGMQQRMLASVLQNLLWRYLDFTEGETACQVKELLVLLGTRD